MTPDQLRLAEIDARWAIEAQAERQRLIEAATGSPHFETWRKLYFMVGVVAVILGTDYFVADSSLRLIYSWILFALLWAGWANIEARRNTRRLDALVKLRDIEKLRRKDGE